MNQKRSSSLKKHWTEPTFNQYAYQNETLTRNKKYLCILNWEKMNLKTVWADVIQNDYDQFLRNLQ